MLPRLTGAPAQGALDSLGISLLDDTGNMRDVIEVYTEVANKVKDISDAESLAVVEGLAGKYHISRMQALLDDLGSANSMYYEMYETSKNSAGSAMRENEIYMQSLQARINMARVEVEKLAVALGNAFLTEGMVGFLQVTSSVLGGITGLVNTVGGLPLILGAIGGVLVLLSTRFQALVTSASAATVSLLGFNGAATRATTATTILTTATNLLSKAWKGFLMSMGVTIPLVVIGVLMEKVLGKMSETRQKMEELESANKDMMSSYQANAGELDTLITRYGELSEAMKYDSTNSELLAEYRDVQNQIGNLMPSLVTGEDAYGNKIVDTYEAMKVKTDLLKEQIALENEKNLAEERATRGEKIELEIENLEDANEKIADYVQMLSNGWEGSNKRNKIPLEYQFDVKVDGATPAELNSIALKLSEIKGAEIKSEDVMEELSDQPMSVLDEISKHLSGMRGEPVKSEDLIETLDGRNIQSLEEMTAKLKEMKHARDGAEKSGKSEVVSHLDAQISQLERYMRSIQDADFAQRQAASNLKTQYIGAIQDAIANQSGLNDNLKQLSSTLGTQLINASTKDNVQDLGEALTTLFTSASELETIDQLMRSFENLANIDADSAEGSLDGLREQISALKPELESLGMTKSQIEVIMNALDNQYEDAKAQHAEITKIVEDEGISYEEAQARMAAHSEGMSESSESASNLKATYDDLSDSIERLVGASSEGIESVSDLFFEYDMLSQSLEGLFQALRQSKEEFNGLTNQELIATLTGKDLTFEQQQLKDAYEARKKVLDELGQVFPDIIAVEEYALQLSSHSVEAARIENEAKRALGEAYQIMKDDVLSAEQEASFNKIKETNTRIEAIKAELKALQEAGGAYLTFVNLQAKALNNENMSVSEQLGLIRSSHFVEDGTSDDVKQLVDALNVEIETLDTSTKSFDRATSAQKDSSSAKKSNSSATKENSDAHKENTDTLDAEQLAQEALNKVTEKYTLTLEKLSNAQKQVQSNQKKYGTYSKKYRESLAEENKLIQKQIELNKKQANDLAALNGKTFNSVTYNSDSGQVYGNGEYLIKNGKLAGWGGAITDTFKTRGGTHRGVDIDGIKGEDLASNVAGKVIKTGWHDLSGNFIEIMEAATGYIHRYAHLDKITVAVNQLVDVGNKIGTIGNTGRVISKYGDGSHLHYETMDANRKLLDPMSYVQKAKKSTYSSPTVNVNVSNTSSSSGKASNKNEQIIWDFFKSQGFSDAASAGIIGNLKQESTAALNPKQPQKLANGKTGKGRGLAQWTVDERWALLEKWAKNNGKDPWSVEAQLEYIMMELTGAKGVDTYTSKKLSDYGGLDKLKNATSTTEAVALFEKVFTRAGKPNNAKRNSYAQDTLNRLSGTGVTSTGKGVISDGYYTESSTYTLNTLAEQEALKAENIELMELLQENYYKSIQSRVEEFDRKRSYSDLIIEAQNAVQERLNVDSKQYENSVNKQYNAEKEKLKLYEEELAYIEKIRKAGKLTPLQDDQLKDRVKEIEIALIESINATKEYYSNVVESYLSRYDSSMQKYADTLDWEETKIKSIDVASDRYNKTLQKMIDARKGQVSVAEKELAYSEKMLKSGNLTNDMYSELSDRVHELKKELIDLNEALHETNYELIQTGVKIRAEDIDDVDFEIDRSQKIRNMYDEGSADYIQEMTFELGKLEEKLKMLWDNGEKIQKDMQGKDLGHQQLKDLEEQLEDNALAYWDVNNAISALKKEMKDMNDIIDEQVAEKRSDMIEKAIEALKDAYEELKEIKMSELDELIDLENDRHDKVMNNYRDELESFTKIIDAQRRQLDDADRDRTHEMNIEELINEKQTHQKRLNVIGHIDTYEAKKEREELQKQIAEIDKQIAEENYQYDRDLRYQQLDDALEAKTEHIENLEEAEDKHNQEVLKDLEKQKSYWEKHYSDLINDEERWNAYRKTMMDGDAIAVKKLLDGIQLEFDSLSAELTASLPKLEDTFDGTWKAVGTQIRENVIANLRLIRDEIAEVEKEAQELLGLKDEATMEHGSSLDTMPDKTITDKNSNKITEANLKVILAKFMNEQIAGKLNPETDASRIKNIKEKSYALASEGRAEGATIEANKSIKEVFDGLNTDQVKQVGDYFSANANQSGFITQDYLEYIQQFGQTAQQGGLLTQGDKQVLMAKYLKEKLANESKNTDEKMAIREIADNMAASGRTNTSVIKGNVGYDEQVRKLSKQQREELGIHMKQNANVIANGELRSKLEDYGNRLQLSYTDDMVHLNTGGMTRAFGSSGGVDGKGGRMAVLHQNEIVNNPVDSAKLLETSTIMESIMNSIRNVVKSPISNIKSMLKPSEQVMSNGSVSINFNVDKMYASEAEVESFGKKIEKKLFRTRGRR